MGAYCAKFCGLPLPLPDSRRVARSAEARVDPSPQERDRVRVKHLRDSTTSLVFREGFALGLEVHRLQKVLRDQEVLRGQCDIPTIPEQLELASPQLPESATPALLQDQIKSLTDLIKEPWCDLQHGRC